MLIILRKIALHAWYYGGRNLESWRGLWSLLTYGIPEEDGREVEGRKDAKGDKDDTDGEKGNILVVQEALTTDGYIWPIYFFWSTTCVLPGIKSWTHLRLQLIISTSRQLLHDWLDLASAMMLSWVWPWYHAWDSWDIANSSCCRIRPQWYLRR